MTFSAEVARRSDAAVVVMKGDLLHVKTPDAIKVKVVEQAELGAEQSKQI